MSCCFAVRTNNVLTSSLLPSPWLLKLPINYSQFSPCGHRTITDTPFVADKFLIISDLTETRFGYYGLSALWWSLTRHKLPNNSCLSFFSERFLVSISKSDSTQSLNKSDSSQRINQVQKIDNSACVFTVSMVYFKPFQILVSQWIREYFKENDCLWKKFSTKCIRNSKVVASCLNTNFWLDKIKRSHAIHGSYVFSAKRVYLGLVKRVTCLCTYFVTRSRTSSLLFATIFRNPQQPELLQDRFERCEWNAQHRYSTRFAAMLQNKLRSSNTGNIFAQAVVQHCCIGSCKALLLVLPPSLSTCHATNVDVTSCGNILRK